MVSLDKAIESGKEHRRPYRGAKAVDSTCRNHGSCEWCHGNRTYKNDKRELAAEQERDEYEELLAEDEIDDQRMEAKRMVEEKKVVAGRDRFS